MVKKTTLGLHERDKMNHDSPKKGSKVKKRFFFLQRQRKKNDFRKHGAEQIEEWMDINTLRVEGFFARFVVVGVALSINAFKKHKFTIIIPILDNNKFALFLPLTLLSHLCGFRE